MTGRYEMLVEQNAEVPMRDGAILRANVYRPDADARFPVINLAELGRLDESQETVARLLELEPNLTLSVLRGRAPIADPKLMDLFLNGLRKAGPLDCGTVGLQKLEEPQEAGHQKTVRVPFGCRSADILPSEGLRTTYVLVRRSCGKGGNRWGRGGSMTVDTTDVRPNMRPNGNSFAEGTLRRAPLLAPNETTAAGHVLLR